MDRFVMVLLVVCAARTVAAGPWPQAQGTSQFSPSFSFYSTQRQFGTNGGLTHLYYEGTFIIAVLTFYGEWGITRDLTVIADAPFTHVEFNARDSLHMY